MNYKIISRDGKSIGTLTGSKHRCQMEGCTGRRVGVRWNDGKISFPCTKGLKVVKHGKTEIYKII